MITCIRVESEGAFRVFSVDNSKPLSRVKVTTHVEVTPAPMAGQLPICQDAGEINKTADGVEASIAVVAGQGDALQAGLIRLTGVFRNEVDALIAISVKYNSLSWRKSSNQT